MKNQRFNHIAILVAAQLGCLVAGMWIHYRLVIAFVDQAVQDSAAGGLSSDAASLFAALEKKDAKGKSAATVPPAAKDAVNLQQVRRVLQAQHLPPHVQWAVCDPQWRVVATGPDAAEGSAAPLPPGRILPWVSSAEDDRIAPGRVAGSLTLSDGRHVAVAQRLPGGAGIVVAHRPSRLAAVAPQLLYDSLPTAGFIVLIWVAPLLAIIAYMVFTRFHDESNKRRAQTEASALKRIQSLARTRDAVIVGLAKLAESRDESTGHHLERIAAYSYRLAAAVYQHPKYRDVVKREFVRIIGISSALHDIGKVGIEDRILLKPGPLTDEERKRMQQHTLIGEQCLLEIERRLGTSNFLQIARQIAVAHHERWDGNGYPLGLIGREIPLAARIIAIADVYDALASRRTYKEPIPHEQCVEIIRQDAGKHFDPDLVEVFLRLEGAFRQIAVLYAQEQAPARVPPPTRIPPVDRLSQEADLTGVGTPLDGSWPGAAGSPTFT